MIYRVVDVREQSGFIDEFLCYETADEEEAVNQAIGEWALLSDYDRKHHSMEVRAYADADALDYDNVEF